MNISLAAMLALAGSTSVHAPALPSKKVEPMICQQQQVTGSRTARGLKVCHTASEWKLLSRQQRDGLGGSTRPMVNIYPSAKP